MASVQKCGRKPERHVKCEGKTGKMAKRGFLLVHTLTPHLLSLPIPSREEIISSPVQEYGPIPGATSGYTHTVARPASPIIDDPSAELERELASTHIRH